MFLILGSCTILGSWFLYRSRFLVLVLFLVLVPVLFSSLGSGTILASWFLYRSWYLALVPFLVLGSGTILVAICTNLTYLILSPHIIKTLHIIIYSMVTIFQQQYTSSKLAITRDMYL